MQPTTPSINQPPHPSKSDFRSADLSNKYINKKKKKKTIIKPANRNPAHSLTEWKADARGEAGDDATAMQVR